MVGEEAAYCFSCGEFVRFARDPVQKKTRIGARRRLTGTCERCGNQLSRFLHSESGPTAHSVRVDPTTLRELQRASVILEVSQRAIVEAVLSQCLLVFVDDELVKLEQAGLITRSERSRRQRELVEPVENWTPPERRQDERIRPLAGLGGLLRRIFGEEE